MKKRFFVKLLTVTYCIGVDIIGLPIYHSHQMALYSNQKCKRKPERLGFNSKNQLVCIYSRTI
ncbi:hypothetical protein [Flavobacterium suaedae]|uniref:hypothetical protein n=1 Tax=Flavobacterium suaedae TaxID=1767027 RepID=UPI00166C284E|nr:hypothetical protein [Flavobacterium suaedae]